MVNETGVTTMVTGSLSPSDSATASAGSSSSPGLKYAMSVMAPTGSSTQCTCTRVPVLMALGSPASTAWISGVSAPSSLISAQAKGRSSGWPSIGSGCQVHETTVPTLDTGTISPSGS